MSLNAGLELPITEGNEHDFPSSISNPNLVWNCSSSMGAQTLANTFFSLSIMLKIR